MKAPGIVYGPLVFVICCPRKCPACAQVAYPSSNVETCLAGCTPECYLWQYMNGGTGVINIFFFPGLFVHVF